MFAGAAAVLLCYTLGYKVLAMKVGLFPPFTLSAVGVAVFCGACAGIAILTFQVGIRYGRISTSWLVINLSTIVPAILSLVIYREWQAGIKWQQIAGLMLVLCSVILLWRDKAVEIARGQQEQPARGQPVGSGSSISDGQAAAAGTGGIDVDRQVVAGEEA